RGNHRRDIAKLQRLGAVCIHDTQMTYLGQFIEFYHQTMRRVDANDSYFFDRAYFDDLIRTPGADVHLFVVLLAGEPISGALFVATNGFVQYHLGGTQEEFLKLAPTKLVLESVRQWARERGLET